jgi:hypothetical protein
MGQTPIYEQLRGERLIADVPATGDDPQRFRPRCPDHQVQELTAPQTSTIGHIRRISQQATDHLPR